MLLDLISPHEYNSYNVKLAKIIGLEESVYISTLMSIYSTFSDKSRLKEDDFCKLDRNYVSSITTIKPSKQKEIDAKLYKLNLIEFSDEDCFKLNLQTIISMFDEKNESAVKLIEERTIVKKRTKEEAIRDNLKLSIKTTNNELIEAYSQWIDDVVAKQGWMSKASVDRGQKAVDVFANHNLDVALEVIGIASSNGYRDMEWAINQYVEKNRGRSTINIKKTVKNIEKFDSSSGVSNEVF